MRNYWEPKGKRGKKPTQKIRKEILAEVEADPSASYWLKDALRSALERDEVDALNDAEALVALLSD